MKKIGIMIMRLVIVVIVLFFVAWLAIDRIADTGHGKLDYVVAFILKFSEAKQDPEVTPHVDFSVEEKRESASATALKYQGKPVEIAKVEDKIVSGPEGDIPIRVYTPIESGIFPIILFCHGGGWVTMNLDTHDNVCRKLSREAEAIVVSVDYRLAPEFPFPAGLNDAYTVLGWVAENGSSISGDSSRIAVAGDSAGGNLSAALAIMARDRKGPEISHQVLIYPATDLSSMDRDSYRYFESGYLLTKESVEWYRSQYVPNPADLENCLVSPLLTEDLSNLPPATLINAEIDVLVDEGKLYAERLRQAGVSVNRVVIPGMIHGFINVNFLKESDETIRIIAEDLKQSL